MRLSWTNVKRGATALFVAALSFGLSAPLAAQTQGAEAEPTIRIIPVPAPRAEAPAAPRPAIWLIEDEDTRIYLFGTIHMLPPELKWRSPAFDRVVAEADELVLEVTDRDALNDPAAMAAQISLGKSVSILSRVSADRRGALRRMIADSGIPIATYDGMQTWAAAMTLAAVQIAQAYGGGESGTEVSGVEIVLEEEFGRLGRPISGVETAAQQTGFLAGLPLRAQRDFLEGMIDGYRFGSEQQPAELGEAAWLSGDVDTLAAEAEAMPPELYEVLLTRRNAAWTDWLVARMERPGKVLFAVGAAHLAGRDSVQAMLAQRGVHARRID